MARKPAGGQFTKAMSLHLAASSFPRDWQRFVFLMARCFSWRARRTSICSLWIRCCAIADACACAWRKARAALRSRVRGWRSSISAPSLPSMFPPMAAPRLRVFDGQVEASVLNHEGYTLRSELLQKNEIPPRSEPKTGRIARTTASRMPSPPRPQCLRQFYGSIRDTPRQCALPNHGDTGVLNRSMTVLLPTKFPAAHPSTPLPRFT